jgi:hypothetical protein
MLSARSTRTPRPAFVVAAAVALGAVAVTGRAAGSDRSRPEGRDLFGTRGGAKKSARENAPVSATVTWSDGRRETGKLSFTPGVPLTVYDLEGKEWVDVELADLAGLVAVPREEKIDREWRWKDYGNDEKVYTGRERPRRWLDHDLALKDGEKMKVHVKGTVVYFDTVPEPGKPKKPKAGVASAEPDAKLKQKAKPVRRRLIIRQYDRGNWGDTLKSLVYVKSIVVGEPGEPGEPGESGKAHKPARADGVKRPGPR